MSANEQFDAAGTAASAMVTWMHYAGIQTERGRSYLRDEIVPAVENFRRAFTAISGELTKSCVELLEFGLQSIDSAGGAPRVVVSDAHRDALHRGLTLFASEAQGLCNAE
ncbi:MAG TPA: hypothetical protein PK093_24850 [Phycisphaerae bacterium]|mgnify:CR=1 FL=1|nr:hypothetical protein [Phycisphaerae bacterium]